ncbi:hypothetical protein J4470_00545 [Candidatus Woesearchaeota archaeon]|nr:hypothetical protein [Candidatus Woesearchaeota archaeon]
MSHINLYIRKEGVIKRATVPVFMAKDLLFSGLNEEQLRIVFNRAVEDSKIASYDSGLLIIDSDKKTVISSQNAFTFNDLTRKAKTKINNGWKYEEITNAEPILEKIR